MSSSSAAEAQDANAKEFLQLKVTGPEGTEIVFKVKPTIKLGKLTKIFAEKMGMHKAYYRFLFDGKRIADEDTPEMLEMEDGDVIEAFVMQKGIPGFTTLLLIP